MRSEQPSEQRPRRSRLLRVAALLFTVQIVLLLWGFCVEPAILRNPTTVINLPGWPGTCSGLRVAVLADLHTGSPHNDLGKLGKIVEATNRAQPDIVLLAGDFVIHGIMGGRFVAPEESAAVLRNLTSRAGVFAVLGNHDWWLDAARVRAAFESVGIPVLEDSTTTVRSDDCQLWIAGVSDYMEGAHDVAAALSDVPASAPVLVFTHNPDVFPDVPARVSLTIAGHTHGGQVYIPGIGRPMVPSRYGERFAIGHIVEDGRHLFVSSGVGTSILPVRFLVPPEVSILELVSR